MKKFICALIALAFIAINISANAAGVMDKVSPWAELYVSDAKNVYNILPGTLLSGDYTKEITREEFCELIYKTLEAKTDIILSSGNSAFSDTENKRIVTLYEEGIVYGTSETTFSPDEPLTREQAATFLARMADYMELTLFKNDLVFTDFEDVSDWAKESVDKIAGINVMSGTVNGKFSPKIACSKEQSIATMIRIIKNIPYLDSKTQVEDDKYYVFSNCFLWIEDASGVLFHLPFSEYKGLDWYKRDGKLIITAITKELHTEFFDLDSGESLFEIPYLVQKITDSSRYIIAYETKYSENNMDSAYTLYGVYSFNGEEILSTEYTFEHLMENGYID